MTRYESSAIVALLPEARRAEAAIAVGSGSWSALDLVYAGARPDITRRILVALAASLGSPGVRILAEWSCTVAAHAADVRDMDSSQRRDDARLCAFHAGVAAEHAVAAMRASILGTPIMDDVATASARRAAEHAALACHQTDGNDRVHLSILAKKLEALPPAATRPDAEQLGGDLLGMKEVLALAAELALTNRPALVAWSRAIAAIEIVGGDPYQARHRAELVADASATLSAARSAAACFGCWQSALIAACPYLDTASRQRFMAAEVDAQIASLHLACVAARRAGAKSAGVRQDGAQP